METGNHQEIKVGMLLWSVSDPSSILRYCFGCTFKLVSFRFIVSLFSTYLGCLLPVPSKKGSIILLVLYK